MEPRLWLLASVSCLSLSKAFSLIVEQRTQWPRSLHREKSIIMRIIRVAEIRYHLVGEALLSHYRVKLTLSVCSCAGLSVCMLCVCVCLYIMIYTSCYSEVYSPKKKWMYAIRSGWTSDCRKVTNVHKTIISYKEESHARLHLCSYFVQLMLKSKLKSK